MEDDNYLEVDEQAYLDQQADTQDLESDRIQDDRATNLVAQSERESIFGFFKHLLGIKDSSKVANLDKLELGRLDLSVRNCEYIACLGYLLHNKSINDFYMRKAEITLATSMSKKGWLPELVVSQKRFNTRQVQPQTSQPLKKGFFNFGKKQESQNE